MNPEFQTRLEGLRKELEGQGYQIQIGGKGGVRSLSDQVHLLATNRTYQGFAVKMNGEVQKGHISKADAENWLTYYNPTAGNHPMPRDPSHPNSPTKTLKSDHLSGTGADVTSPAAEGNKTMRNAFYKALSAAAKAQGLSTPFRWDPNHVRFSK
jgi:hypothetical protein